MKNQDHQSPTVIKATKATPEEKAWLAYQQKVEEETPKRLEEVAKFLSGIFSIVLTIFLIGDKELIQGLDQTTTKYISGAWLLSLLMVLLVLFPRGYRLNKDSAESIQKSHRKAVNWKYACLIIATGLFFSGFLVLVITVFFS